MTTPTDAPDAPACAFPGRPGPAGHINACQLCPQSPTYWRDPKAADDRRCTSATAERPS